jgi:hydrophobe/amphiphile efflux-1 (HAE1) family protein
MKISDISIKNPVMAWMIMLFFMVFGAISFSRLGISQFPDVDFPMVNVSVGLTGASPEVVESNIIEPLEDILTSTEGLKSLTSTSRSGQGNVSIEFDLNKNIDVAMQDIQAKVAQAQRRLPKDIDPPIVSKTNPEDQPIMWISLSTKDQNRRALMKYTDEFLRDQFISVDGVGDILLGGFANPLLSVKVIPSKLKQYNITVLDVIDTIQAEHFETPGGQVDDQNLVFNIRIKGEAASVEEFKQIIISRRSGQMVTDTYQRVRLSDVADIKLDVDDAKRTSRFNTDGSVSLGIKKQRGTNSVAVARAIKEKINALSKQLPQGYSLDVNFDTTIFIERSIHELNKHLMIAVLLTALVCWVFLGSWTATINVLLSIPTSILGTFIALYFLGYTLNTFTLLALTLAIGIVVDDAIMVLENIFRHQQKGSNNIVASIVGAREIALAAIAATAAVIAIFIPVAFMKGLVGKYFLQFGVTISFAVFLSLIEALTITPMRCSVFVHHAERKSWIGRFFDGGFNLILKIYHSSLQLALRWKWSVLFASFVIMGAGFTLLKKIPKEFTPSQESGLLQARFQLPTGTSFQVTNERIMKVEKWLLDQPDVKQISANIGGFGGGASETNVAMMFIGLKPKAERRNTQAELIEIFRKELNGLVKGRVSIQDPTSRGSGGGGRGFPIEFIVKGPDWKKLSDQVEKLMKAMEESKMIVDIDTNLLQGLPEIQVIPNREKAALTGISVNTVSRTINTMIAGSTVGQYADGGKRYDIRVELEKNDQQRKELETLQVANIKGNFMPLNSVAEFTETKTLQQINRNGRLRAITVYANLAPGITTDKAWEFINGKSAEIFEPTYFVEAAGSSQMQKETFSSLIFALILGIVVAYMILAAQFNSFLDPVTILLAMPYSIAGAFVGLYLTGQTLNMYSLIGVLLLLGIVKKNSILLVEFANQVRSTGKSALVAMAESGFTRLRPILMTSFATIAGAVPIAFARGEGAELTRGMAITIIAGVFISTILTLYVIPCFYVIMEKIKTRDANQEKVKKAFILAGEEGFTH